MKIRFQIKKREGSKKMRKQKKTQKQTGHKKLLSTKAGTATSSPIFSGTSPLLRLSHLHTRKACSVACT